MKSLFVAIFAFGVVAQAKLSCFKADQFVWGLPQEICLESVSASGGVLRMIGKDINLSTKDYYSDDYYMDDPDLEATSAIFKFVEFHETCGSSLRSTLEASFRMDSSGSVDNISGMTIEVPFESTNDSCHSGWSRGVVKYSYYSK